MTTEKTLEFVSKEWDETVIPTLSEYITIPNVSPVFDPEWATNGLIEKAGRLLFDWVKKQNVPELEIEFLETPGKTPLIFMTIPASDKTFEETILMYGHWDKQPPLTETWAEGLGPYTPVIKDGKLYGRGGADDGYSICASVLSIKALKEQGLPHARIVAIIEASEESGSPHLVDYIHQLKGRIGTPSLIICLDSGCGNYTQFWTTTSLRGLITGDLRVDILKEGCHSGKASGIVPSSFRILRLLLDRIEDSTTGEIKIPEFHTEIPEYVTKQITACANSLGNTICDEFTFVGDAKPVSDNHETLLLNKTWKPTLSITGVDGLPTLEQAGNVLRTHTAVKLSVRIPPKVKPAVAGAALKKVLEENPPFGAKVTFDLQKVSSGWESPPLAAWLDEALHKASQFFCKEPANYLGEGGTIPFMAMLGEMFPESQFVITGLLGPESNAHGPNEMLHIDMGKKVTACVASIVHQHYLQFKKSD